MRRVSGLRQAWGATAAGLVPLTCAVPSTASADAGDPRIWSSVVVTVPLAERLRLKADALVETTSSGSRTGLQLMRVVALRQANGRVSYGGGYTRAEGRTGGGLAYTEHRAVQELNLLLVTQPNGAQLTTRTRLEERGRESSNGVALRFRHQTRLELPITGAVGLVAWNEYFHRLNGVAWSGSAGPGLMLNFVGAKLPLGKAVSLEPGYLNQLTFVRGRDRVGHVMAVTVTFRL